ncbi:MAG TPA: alpha/beta hydrolase [bacterium]|nr:alpha/beta hydrolase [bacterium]
MNFYDFNPESKQPLLHLAHANGFPPATYASAIKPLLEKFHVVSFYARPFWPDCPPASTLKNWDVFADDLIKGLEQLKVSKITAIGHSLGGVATLNAAIRRADLIGRVVLIDPTMLPPSFLFKVFWYNLLGMEIRKGLVEGALRRRRQWESREKAYESFKEKPLFKKWPDEILRAYVDGMTTPDEKGGMKLAYSPEWEAQIYRTIPTDVWKKAKQLTQPALVIRGETSNTFMADSEKAFKKANPSVRFAVIPRAGHLVAQEAPGEVAQILTNFLIS